MRADVLLLKEKGETYSESQIDTVAEMHPLQAWREIFAASKHSVGIPSDARAMSCLGKRKDRGVCNTTTFYQAYALQLGEAGEALDRRISEKRAASQVDVADTVAVGYQTLDSIIGNETAVAQMDIVKVFTQLGDGVDGSVCDVPALGEQQVPQPRRRIDNFSNRGISEATARGQVENPQVLVALVRR